MCIPNRLAALGRLVSTAVLVAALGGCAPALMGLRPPSELESCADILREIERTNRICQRSNLRERVLGPTRRAWPETFAEWEAVVLRRQALEMAFAERSCALARPEWVCPKPCYEGNDFWGLDIDDSCIVLCETKRRDLPPVPPPVPSANGAPAR